MENPVACKAISHSQGPALLARVPLAAMQASALLGWWSGVWGPGRPPQRDQKARSSSRPGALPEPCGATCDVAADGGPGDSGPGLAGDLVAQQKCQVSGSLSGVWGEGPAGVHPRSGTI